MEKILKKHRVLYIATIIVGVIISLVNVLVAYIIGRMIDNITKGGLDKIPFFILQVVLFIVCYTLFGVLYSYLGGTLSRKILHDVKSRVYRNLSVMPIYKYQKRDVSFYYNMLTHDINEINENYIERKYDTVVSIIAFFVSLIALLSINWIMSIIFIGLTLLIVIIPSFLMKLQEKSRINFSSRNEKFMKELENILSGFESVKVLNVGNRLFQKMKKEDRHLEDSRLRRTVVDSAVSYVVSGISFSVQLLCILVGSYFVIKGKITTGGLIMAVQILNSVIAPINIVSTNKNLINSTRPLREKIEEFLIEPEQAGKKIQEGDIVLENVSVNFSNKQVFHGFNYTFKRNNSYIIIGESGSGKSTLAKLIAGFYSDFDGKILYNNTDIREIDSNSIPGVVRYIGANTYVINDNLRENIRLYREYTDEEVDIVAGKVGFGKEMLCKSELGNGGKFISSGEYQRIAIARAMLEKPYCIILDEPTANLDKENTKNIQEIIKKLDTPIKIVISHDYDDEYLRSFDNVLIMGNQGVNDSVN